MSTQPENPFDFQEEAPAGHAYEKLVPRSKRMTAAVLALVFVLALEGYGIWTIVMSARVGHWPQTKGTITKSDFFKKVFGSTHRADIEYRYEVDGVVRTSKNVKPDGTDVLSESKASVLADRFPKGAPVEVYYDPHDPATSYLMTEVDLFQYVLVVGLLVIAVGLAVYLHWEWRMGKKASLAKES